MFPRDLILEGVRPTDVSALQRIRQGGGTLDDREVRRLEAKGWVDVLRGIPLITLTGATLLDQ
jgi:hypothetical protein